ncbi:MAG: hypothetical protein Q9221_004790 [Calogaya cf. arnoldii]
MGKEAQPFYWPNVRLYFLGTKHLLDYLTTVPHNTLCKLRHISVRGYPLPCYPNEGANAYRTYGFQDVLPLFPGLQLTTLWLGDPYHGEWAAEDGWGHDAAYWIVEALIKSKGFKELIYVVESDQFMKPVHFTRTLAGPPRVETQEISERHPQPSIWDAMMKERDGADSGARVELYRLLDNGKRRVPLRTEFETVQEASAEKDGQIEVRVRRGKDADYVQNGEHGELAQPLSELFKQYRWQEILDKKLYVDPEDDPTAHL